MDPPTRSAHNRRCDAGDREEAGDAIARRDIKNMAQPTLKEKTARGLLWGTLSNGAQQVLTLVFGIWLARMLTPDDYGMVGQLGDLFTHCRDDSGKRFHGGADEPSDGGAPRLHAVFWFACR